MFEIEKNVPLPPKNNVGRPSTPLTTALSSLEVGDALNCGSMKVRAVSSTASWLAKRLGRKFATRTIDGVLRIYRVV
jgi:hypothetical protein